MIAMLDMVIFTVHVVLADPEYVQICTPGDFQVVEIIQNQTLKVLYRVHQKASEQSDAMYRNACETFTRLNHGVSSRPWQLFALLQSTKHLSGVSLLMLTMVKGNGVALVWAFVTLWLIVAVEGFSKYFIFLISYF